MRQNSYHALKPQTQQYWRDYTVNTINLDYPEEVYVFPILFRFNETLFADNMEELRRYGHKVLLEKVLYYKNHEP